MAFIDLHTDILTDIAIRREAGDTSVFDTRHYPALKRNDVNTLICVIWVEPKYRNHKLARFKQLLNHALNEINESKHAHLCTSVSDMVNKDGTINIFLGIEGMSFLEEAVALSDKNAISNYFDELHQIGFRTGILAWNEINQLASGSAAHNAESLTADGLTDAGAQVIQKMMDLGWLVDVSHLDEQTFWDIYRLRDYPLFASHSNARALCDHDRNLTDEQLKAIAERNGIIGINAYAGFLKEGQASLDDYIDHIEYIADLIGVEHVAVGFDFMNYLAPHDLGTSFSKITADLESISDLPKLTERMFSRGWKQKEINMITEENAKRYLNNIGKG